MSVWSESLNHLTLFNTELPSTSMKMALTEILLVLTGIICIQTKLVHVDLAVAGCSSCDGEVMNGLDGEEMAHADWQAKQYVMTLPEFAVPFQYEEGAYEYAVGQQQVCKANLETAIEAYRHPAVAEAPPMSSIYPRDDVTLGTANTLICLIQGFYPPHINVTWTRNNKPVTAGVSTSQLRMNVNDGTYSKFSTLQFTPEKGEIYTCTVEHSALDRPRTREFDVEVARASVFPSVICGVGVTLGVLEVAIGVVFFIKGRHGH